MNRFTFLVIVTLMFMQSVAQGDSSAPGTSLFPRAEIVKIQVYFWKKVYTEITTTEGYLHDSESILPIYEKVSVQNLSRKEARNLVNAQKRQVEQKLYQLADALQTQQTLTAEQSRLLQLFYANITPHQLRTAAHRLRFQYGLSDRFQQGLIRAGAYMPYIKKIFEQQGLPMELVHIPHVESSFNWVSHSKIGAKGIWQFMSRTGREYMKLDASIDERIDPFISTQAAAKLLKKNYEILGSWPLAITAYNHGPNGIRRIAKRMESEDLGYLIRHYESRSFNFASKNFYAEVLAAGDVAENYQQYFGQLTLNEPLHFQNIRLPQPMYLQTVLSILDYPRSQILNLNPALTYAVIQGYRQIPTSYLFKVPERADTPIRLKPQIFANFSSAQAAESPNTDLPLSESTPTSSVSDVDIAATPRERSQALDQRLEEDGSEVKWEQPTVIVQKGDSLFSIALQHRVSVPKLAEKNGLSLENPRIYPNQKLYLPLEPQKISVIKIPITPAFTVSAEEPLTRYVSVFQGDTLLNLSKRYQIDIDELASVNQLKPDSSTYPGQKLKLPGSWLPDIEGSVSSNRPATVIVRSGDSLWSISQKVGIPMHQLMLVNGLSQRSVIYPGQQLIVGL
ncbi:LysM peptidoglycan-binding domain-containing protein [Deltaproteobacteria bacterium TL4]